MELSEEAVRNELAAVRLFLKDCGMAEDDSLLRFLREAKKNGFPKAFNFKSVSDESLTIGLPDATGFPE